MDKFIEVHSWFEDKYKVKSDSRYFTFKVAMNYLKNMKPILAINIVETGTTRLKDDWGGGMSTLLLADFMFTEMGRDSHLWTCDISAEAIKTCQEITSFYNDQITYIVDDSLHFLRNFDQKIDLLYLDSMDYPLDGSSPIPCQEHQLEEVKLGMSHMEYGRLILLDDNDLPKGGKTKLAKEYLSKKAECLYDFQQSLWII